MSNNDGIPEHELESSWIVEQVNSISEKFAQAHNLEPLAVMHVVGPKITELLTQNENLLAHKCLSTLAMSVSHAAGAGDPMNELNTILNKNNLE